MDRSLIERGKLWTSIREICVASSFYLFLLRGYIPAQAVLEDELTSAEDDPDGWQVDKSGKSKSGTIASYVGPGLDFTKLHFDPKTFRANFFLIKKVNGLRHTKKQSNPIFKN
jgi:hypothetical protein